MSARARGSLHPVVRPALLASLLIVLLVSGCATAPDEDRAIVEPAGETVKNLLVVDGLEREVIIRDAETETGDLVPAIVMLHGAGGSGTYLESVSGMSAVAKKNGFVVAYPDGTTSGEDIGGLAWNAGRCCGRPFRASIDDVGFISAVIDELVTNHAVDPTRVYLAGFSNGGMLSYRFACDVGVTASDTPIAGIAVVGGAFNVLSCAAPEPVSVLVIHGTADPTVPYAGGPPSAATIERLGKWTNASVADASTFWADRDGCSSHSITDDDGSVTVDSYNECADGAFLEVVSLIGGTHHWPTKARGDINASALIARQFDLTK